MQFFKGLDEGFYWCVFFIMVLFFILSLAFWPGEEERMAKLGYEQKIETVQITKEVTIWVKKEK